MTSIKLVGGINSTELWMIKERFEAGHLKMLQEPEKAWPENSGRYNTLFGDETGVYCFSTNGLYSAMPGSHNSDWCSIIRINKLTSEHASQLLSGWPYD